MKDLRKIDLSNWEHPYKEQIINDMKKYPTLDFMVDENNNVNSSDNYNSTENYDCDCNINCCYSENCSECYDLNRISHIE